MSPRHARIRVLCRVAPIPLFRLIIFPQWCSAALHQRPGPPFSVIRPAGPVTPCCEELGFRPPTLGVWATVEPCCLRARERKNAWVWVVRNPDSSLSGPSLAQGS